MPKNSDLQSKIDSLKEKIRLLKIENDRLAKRAGDASDIYKKAETALNESQTRFKTVFENSRDAIGISIRGIHVFANPAYYKLFGLKPDTELKGLPILELIAPGSREHIKEYVRARSQREPIPFSYRTRGLKTDGTEFDMEVNVSIYQENNEDHTLVILRDISDRLQAEEALRESEKHLRDLAESLPLTIFEMDTQGNFTFVNRAGLDQFGYSKEDLETGANVSQMLAPEDRVRGLEQISRRVRGERSRHNEYTGVRKDGTKFPVDVVSSPIVRNNVVIGIRGILSDISERKKAEEQALRVQKLESIGQLAGGIAHDFNNLLQGIFSYISVARRNIDKQKKCLGALDQAEKALQLSVKLTNQLLTFSKGGKPVKKVIELMPVIEDAAEFALSGSRCRHRLTSDSDLWQTEADEGQIGQVIQNIVLNAQQAMPDGGCIEIAARNVEIPGDGLPMTLPKGRYVEIAVKDSGTGIPEKYINKIFDPYFTTKEKGNGLGLATSYSIIQNHNGFIDVRSIVGEETTFTIYLPAIEAGNKAGSFPEPEPKRTARAGKILLMDDDEVIREATGILIEDLGLEVEFAVDGEQAIKKYMFALLSERPFSAVILDLTIRGGMGGIETIAKLRRMDTAVKAIVSSGYSDDGASNYKDQGFKAFLKKPYTDAELREVLDMVLDD